MALTAEQEAEIQLEVDKQKFRLQAELDAGIAEKEAQRRALDNAQSTRSNRMELVRIAKDVLMENQRSKPVDERNVLANDIATFASSLMSYVEGE